MTEREKCKKGEQERERIREREREKKERGHDEIIRFFFLSSLRVLAC